MSHAPIETVEEDAADLQFPKGELFLFVFIIIKRLPNVRVCEMRLGL